MKKYGNIRFNRRVVAFVCMLVVAVSVLMPCQVVEASSYSQTSNLSVKTLNTDNDGSSYFSDHNYVLKYESASPVYSCIIEASRKNASGQLDACLCWCSLSPFDSYNIEPSSSASEWQKYEVDGVYYLYKWFGFADYFKLAGSKSDIFYLYDDDSLSSSNKNSFLIPISEYVKTGKKSDGMIIGGSGYLPNTQAYSEIGCLDNVQMETYITNKKELIDADENADLSKINQDKVIVYSSSTTSGIDLSKGGYRVQLYGSYAWQDKSGNIKSEDKGHKTFIKEWDAQDNIKGLDRTKYRWIDWKSANDKVEADKTDKAHKPNVFEKMTTYANYQYEPIWYLRIVSQDNKYGAWVKLYNSTNKGKYRSESVDDDGIAVPDSGGGYNKPKDTSEITGTGDTPEDAKNNVPKAEEKQDNDDLNDSANGNNSTFDKLEQFTKGIGDVPKMIADIFSFLPSWCLEVVAIGFALLMILVVVKFIRG